MVQKHQGIQKTLKLLLNVRDGTIKFAGSDSAVINECRDVINLRSMGSW